MSDIDLVKKVRVYAEEAEKNGFEVLTVPLRDLFPLLGRMEASERERDELRGRLTLVREQRDTELNKNTQLEAELARRDAAAGDPVAWQYRYNDGKVGDWKTVDSESECNHSPCYERRAIYTAAQPAVLPPNVMNHLSDAANTASEWTHGDEHSCKVNRTALIAAVQALGAQQQKVVELPDHKFRECVNGLLEEAIAYAGTQQLRARIAARLSGFVKPKHAANVKWEVKK